MKGHNHLDVNSAALLIHIRNARERAARERRDIQNMVDELKPKLAGRRVIAHRRLYQIVSLRIGFQDSIEVTGVTVSARGKVGRRQFRCGDLFNCEFVE